MRSTELDTRIGESYITSLQACKHRLFAKLLNFRMPLMSKYSIRIEIWPQRNAKPHYLHTNEKRRKMGGS